LKANDFICKRRICFPISRTASKLSIYNNYIFSKEVFGTALANNTDHVAGSKNFKKLRAERTVLQREKTKWLAKFFWRRKFIYEARGFPLERKVLPLSPVTLWLEKSGNCSTDGQK
jgi:hypothetical protein